MMFSYHTSCTQVVRCFSHKLSLNWSFHASCLKWTAGRLFTQAGSIACVHTSCLKCFKTSLTFDVINQIWNLIWKKHSINLSNGAADSCHTLSILLCAVTSACKWVIEAFKFIYAHQTWTPWITHQCKSVMHITAPNALTSLQRVGWIG